MNENHPFGMTAFEWRQEIGEPQAWVAGEDVLAVAAPIICNPREKPDWYIEARYLVLRRRLALVGLAISPISLYPWPPRSRLDTDVIRSIHFDDLYERAVGWLSIRHSVGLAIEVDAAALRHKRRPGRQGRPDVWYAKLAFRYLEHYRTSKAPLQALADDYDVSASSARDFVHQARERGLLTETRKGKGGGELTPKALGLLASERQHDPSPSRARSTSKATRKAPNQRSGKKRGN